MLTLGSKGVFKIVPIYGSACDTVATRDVDVVVAGADCVGVVVGSGRVEPVLDEGRTLDCKGNALEV